MAQEEKPEWCRALPRPEYKTLQRVLPDEPWFEVYRVPGFVLTNPGITKGHTPDAICLIDRENGLLFTGDTYYPAPIWLYRPETDLVAYMASVRKLAALAPQVRLVLGAHNVPVAQPEVLPKLEAAIRQVVDGKVTPKSEHRTEAEYQVGDFSFRMRNPLPAVNSKRE